MLKRIAERERSLLLVWVGSLVLASCATVKVEPPDKPIVINLNVKIEHEIRVKVDRELEDLFSDNSELF